MQVEPLTPAIGGLVSGINLCEPITPAQRDEILASLVKHHVLFFENQPLTPRQHRDAYMRELKTFRKFYKKWADKNPTE